MKKIFKINLIIALVLTTITILIFGGNGLFDFFDFYFKSEITQIIAISLFIYGFWFISLNFAFLWINLPIYFLKVLSYPKKVVDEHYIDSKESIYTRELPQKYNSVIAGEILDFKSNFKEEYIAGVIELISKGHIIEAEDKLIVNTEKETDCLLKNEKYILETCTKLNNYSWYDFFTKIREDMFDLGLYKENKFIKFIKEKIINMLKRDIPITYWEICVFYIAMFLIALMITYNFKLLLILLIATYLYTIIWYRKNKLTEFGEIEKEKIGKLKLFFERETNFKDKTKEEREIWGRYSAFAVALGTNTELKEEILKKCFKRR